MNTDDSEDDDYPEEDLPKVPDGEVQPRADRDDDQLEVEEEEETKYQPVAQPVREPFRLDELRISVP